MSPRVRRGVIGALLLLLIVLVFRAWRAPEPEPVPAAVPAPETPAAPVVEATPSPTPRPAAPLAPGVPADLDRDERARRIRTEIKISLSGLYAAERAFFAEAGRYSTDFDVVGWMPTSQKLSAKVGFLYPYQPPPDEYRDRMDRFDTDQIVEASKTYEDPESHMSYQDSAARVSLRSLGSYCEMNCTADATSFEAVAAANLDDDDELDVWRINDRKELVHLFDDLAGGPPLATGTPPPSSIIDDDPGDMTDDVPPPPTDDQLPLGPPGEEAGPFVPPGGTMPPEELEPEPAPDAPSE